MNKEQIRMYALEVALKSLGSDGATADELVSSARQIEAYINSANSGLVS